MAKVSTTGFPVVVRGWRALVTHDHDAVQVFEDFQDDDNGLTLRSRQDCDDLIALLEMVRERLP